jgi:hypothetical protein
MLQPDLLEQILEAFFAPKPLESKVSFGEHKPSVVHLVGSFEAAER